MQFTPLDMARVTDRVQRALDRVHGGGPLEDAFIELKATWPEPSRAARQLAGAANAAHGERLIWIIGADESGKVSGADQQERSSWWAQVQKHIDGSPPDLLVDVIVRYNDAHVVALVFDTTRPPYVYIRTPEFLEIPWRKATGTVSARHEDLVRILVPAQQLPDVQILQALIFQHRGVTTDSNRKEWQSWYLDLQLYLVPPVGQDVVIPDHQCSLKWTLPGYLDVVSEGDNLTVRSDDHSLTVRASSTETIVSGPGMLHVSASTLGERDKDWPQQAYVLLSILPARAQWPRIVEVTLTRRDVGGYARYELASD
jgi:hypothetical protein